MDCPPYWGNELQQLIRRRAPMPDIPRWQSTYVRYHGQTEGHVTQTGWELPAAQRELGGMSTDYPLGIQMRITQAPAEFAVPVKQDRRLTPDFKLRVEVRHRGRCCFPLTIKAHILSQQEKDNLPEWKPEGMADFESQAVRNNGYMALQGPQVAAVQRKAPTELKGTTFITHNFESNRSHFIKNERYQRVMSSGAVGSSTVPGHYLQGVPQIIQTPISGAGHTYLHNQDSALIQGLPPEQLYIPHRQPYYNDDVSMYYNSRLSGDFADYSHMMQDILDTDGPHLPQDNSFDRLPPMSIKTEHFQRDYSSQMEHKPAVDELINVEEETMVHEFEFANLEFLKPTRMSKVYICFACTILEYDLMYCVYHIPTVGICRAEQRSKACEKLGIPRSYVDPEGVSQNAARSETSVHSATPTAKRHHGDPEIFDMRDALMEMEDSESRVGGSEPEQSLPYSRQALRDWIIEEYDRTGLKRRLTELDMQTLESQAGFPIGGGPVGISLNQWNEFTSQFRDVLNLLRRIAPVWDNEDPCVISGFHLDRRGTVQALQQEPAGTFVCRLSLSMPGTLVLSCKVRPEVERADTDGLIHAVIRIDDLQERKVDTWIRDFPSATHVLDVYTQKRVDKRKVFHAKYTRMKHMEDMFSANVISPTE